MSDDSLKCKKFVSEAEVEEIKRKRQEEWDKVRKPDDPEEAPEEEYDPRSLYDRLQEQKDLKQLEQEESRRLKHLIKGLDDEEVSFLELVDRTKMEAETRLWEEERKEILEFRQAVSNVTQEEQEAKLQHYRKTLKLQSADTSKKSQQAMLAGALKRKASTALSPEKKKNSDPARAGSPKSPSSYTEPTQKRNTAVVSCLGILPGLGAYTDSSDSENSSISDVEPEYDLVGRRVIQACAQPAQTSQSSQAAAAAGHS